MIDAVTIIFASLTGSPLWIVLIVTTQFCRRLEFEIAIRWWVRMAFGRRGGRA